LQFIASGITAEQVAPLLNGQTSGRAASTRTDYAAEYFANPHLAKVGLSTDRDGRVITYQHDLLNRQTKETWLDSQSPPVAVNTIVSRYDKAGQLTQISDNAATYAYTYDYAGQMLSESNAGTSGMPTVALNYTYYANGQRQTLQDTIGTGASPPTRQFGYVLDAAGRLQKITDATNSADLIGFQYNDVDHLSQLTRVNGTTGDVVPTTTYYYEAVTGRLSGIDHTLAVGLNSSSPSWTKHLDSFNYAYDRADRLTSIDSLHDGKATYAYDANGQLTSADGAGTSSDETYAYDSNGNRTSSTLSGTSSTLTYGNQYNQIQLQSDGTYNYTYDAEGIRAVKAGFIRIRSFRLFFRHVPQLDRLSGLGIRQVDRESVFFATEAMLVGGVHLINIPSQ
jgi:YD repeat-containing protein